MQDTDDPAGKTGGVVFFCPQRRTLPPFRWERAAFPLGIICSIPGAERALSLRSSPEPAKNTAPFVEGRPAQAVRRSSIERVKDLNEINRQTLRKLNELLPRIAPEDLPAFLAGHGDDLLTGDRPFSDYMRSLFREKGILQQNVFLAADISENYGYKLISGEKHTVQRDVILRLCLAGRFDREETQEALILYGMAPLHPRFPRDLVLLAAIHNRMFDVHLVDELLVRCSLPPLTARGE